ANTALKYGAPTVILPRFSACMMSGYNVPSSTAPVAVMNTTLLTSSIASRDTTAKRPPIPTLGARHAYSRSEAPMTTTRKVRMYMPRRGATAKACTEDSTPERTRNVPIRDSENVMIASSAVQLRNAPRFSVTASEWINAAPASHGMNEAFSTGSQNHQPPQPSTVYAHQLPSTMPR